jgi:hypothetical protein
MSYDYGTHMRDTVEDLVWQFAIRSNDQTRKWLTAGGLSALEAGFAALGWDDPHYVDECGCQHPGCVAWASCGTPTPDGYKQFCGLHYTEFRNAECVI